MLQKKIELNGRQCHWRQVSQAIIIGRYVATISEWGGLTVATLILTLILILPGTPRGLV